MSTTTGGLLRGLVHADLVRRVLGEATIRSRGPGIDARAGWEPFHLTVQDADRRQNVLRVSAGEVADPGRWLRELELEAASGPDRLAYTGDPGVGYGRLYSSRHVFAFGAGVHVLRGHRLIRVTVHHWPEASAGERLHLAEEIVRDVDTNVTAHLEQRTGQPHAS